MNSNSNVCTLQCNHQFHNTCIFFAISYNECPLCRSKFMPSPRKSTSNNESINVIPPSRNTSQTLRYTRRNPRISPHNSVRTITTHESTFRSFVRCIAKYIPIRLTTLTTDFEYTFIL